MMILKILLLSLSISLPALGNELPDPPQSLMFCSEKAEVGCSVCIFSADEGKIGVCYQYPITSGEKETIPPGFSFYIRKKEGVVM